MKKKLRIISYLFLYIAGCLSITSCGALQSEKLSQSDNEIVSYQRMISGFHTASIEAEQPEDDYEIAWSDPGMEEWMRLLLHKDGAIYHSDVSDIQVLYLVYGGSTPYGILFDELPDQAEAFTSENTIEDPNNDIYAENKIKCSIRSLEDLRHFEHLQVFGYINLANERGTVDLSALAECPALSVLYLANVDLEKPDTLVSITPLQNLYLDNTGALDLTMFENMQNLSVLSLSDIKPLTQKLSIDRMQLQYLKLSCMETFPSIDVLEESAVKYLDLSVDRSDQALCDVSSLEHLTKMNGLCFLNVYGQKAFDGALLSEIWKSNPDLNVWNIKNTPAASENN